MFIFHNSKHPDSPPFKTAVKDGACERSSLDFNSTMQCPCFSHLELNSPKLKAMRHRKGPFKSNVLGTLVRL